jgi:hypothetical protein
MDHYERADVVSGRYDGRRIKNSYLLRLMNVHATAFLQTIIDYRPSQELASITAAEDFRCWASSRWLMC